MVQVLFVCLGNICRSPMAEAVLRQKIKDKGLSEQLVVDSAGTGDWHIGKPPHEGTRGILDNQGISYSGMKARQLHPDDFQQFTYIVCMDRSNESNVMNWEGASSKTSTVIRFMSLLPEESVEDVPDPYHTGNFDEVYRLVSSGCSKLLERIVQEQHLLTTM
ncbi:low molecular weight phosphotyrosine protein phosphatase [Paenibacillus profundus]|uniref:protein-tyrosine-phosphatase n=1 Tax=Paenibacillus profundus TaxID=1173085 RepID=A0ABS8YLN6_9BACL|nr:low molecular weight protein-tyrosine-phosphatase [Paenibacillus profundus]MCE5172109.1 low molecular weight phosphotyrosine protein phosphatase [Paenibacillus profundus]